MTEPTPELDELELEDTAETDEPTGDFVDQVSDEEADA